MTKKVAVGLAITSVVLCSIFLGYLDAQSQLPARADNVEGVEVLARGPVHEAFANPVVFDPEPGPVIRQKPPEAIEELPPDQRPEGRSIAWIPGYWNWDDERDDFIWISGLWRDVPPGRQWVTGYWAEGRGGHQYVPGYWAPDDETEVAYLPEPPETLEAGPSQQAPGADYVWSPGHWHWYQTRYVWRPGFWMQPQQNWTWVPAHYVWAPRGYVFVNGYWDALINQRGLLFSPVYFQRVAYTRPNFFWTPRVFVNMNQFVNHLFVWPRYSQYYFGDYYASNYFQRGVYPWFAFHGSDWGYDPIFANYRYRYRNDPDWMNRLRDDFRRRRDNENDRPGRTFVDVRKPSREAKDQVLVASLDDSSVKTDVKLAKIDKEVQTSIAREVKAIRDVQSQRAKIEVQGEAKAKGEVATKAKLPKSPIRADAQVSQVKPAEPKQVPDLDEKAKAKPRGEGKKRRPPQIDSDDPAPKPQKSEPKSKQPAAKPADSKAPPKAKKKDLPEPKSAPKAAKPSAKPEPKDSKAVSPEAKPAPKESKDSNPKSASSAATAGSKSAKSVPSADITPAQPSDARGKSERIEVKRVPPEAKPAPRESKPATKQDPRKGTDPRKPESKSTAPPKKVDKEEDEEKSPK